jgi:hypothetical protein
MSKQIQKNVNVNIVNDKNELQNKNNKNKNLTINNIIELLNIHIEYVNKIIAFKKKTGINTRLPNFPECISENIVREYINHKEKRICICSQSGGDLEIIDKISNIKVEVKCFTSSGPTSFGPTEKWNELYFIDATKFMNNEFKIYKINLSNNSDKFKSIKINSTETFEDQCKNGKRPRLGFKLLCDQLLNDVKLVYDGSLYFN